MNNEQHTANAGRIRSIDQFRGFAVILMVLFNFGSSVRSVPAWLKHSPDIGLYFADLGAPAFLFAIALTFGLSFRRREEQSGLFPTVGHFLRRYLALLGVGAVFSAGQTFLGLNPHPVDWGVLQAIGCSGLLTLLVIRFPTCARFAVGLGLLAVYQFLLDTFWLERVLNSPHGGLAGSLSWAAILILATGFANVFHDQDRRKFLPLLALLFFAAGTALGEVVPLSKVRVSASYGLVSLGFSGIIFSIFYLTKFDLKYFAAWGQNPFLLYFLSLLLTGLFVLPDIPAWHRESPLWLAGLQATGLVLVLGSIARRWQRKGFRFSL